MKTVVLHMDDEEHKKRTKEKETFGNPNLDINKKTR